MRSCLYEGRVYHRRHTPVGHQFSYHLSMACFDLDELESLLASRQILSDDRFAAISFPTAAHARQYPGNLRERISHLFQEQAGRKIPSRIRLLTQLRYFGVYFSPLNLFFLDEPGDEFPQFVVAEVNNIPWGEQHHYVLRLSPGTEPGTWTCEHDKQLHVSPFMPMNHRYRWTFSEFDESISLRLANYEGDQQVFEAGMSLRKRVLGPSTIRGLPWNVPWMSWKVVGAIYLEAWKLWWKKCPVYPHPQGSTENASTTEITLPRSL